MCPIYSKRAVLSLYKALLRKADTLQYTDKDFFIRRVRGEFAANRHLTQEKDRLFYLKVCYFSCLLSIICRLLSMRGIYVSAQNMCFTSGCRHALFLTNDSNHSIMIENMSIRSLSTQCSSFIVHHKSIEMHLTDAQFFYKYCIF